MTYEDQRPQTYPGGYFQPQTSGQEPTQAAPQYGQPYGQSVQPYYGAPQYPPAPQPQYVGPRRSVTKQRKDTSHLLHLVLTIFTGGAWGLFVWLPLTCWHRFGPKQKIVTRYR